ncbi:MAG: COX15/CtaA family protein [Bacteroidota bacterium]|nr:COX15/CtaA family protein [Bacteroidota bacterium]MDP4253358.1 COX15/CtaA family protein [Bacteroidota bacterium]
MRSSSQFPLPERYSRLADPALLPVARWVFAGIIMLVIQVLLGGITRLTGSGLSITEWNIVTGTLPPLNAAQWQEAFDKYRQTPQFRLINFDFGLSEFKFIFFWEWLHRLWARLVGVVFVVGFVWLLAKRNIKSTMWQPLIILFLLGALQGAVGWIMVLSGLSGDAMYVQPVKLALHFIFAMGLIVYACWFLLQLTIPPQEYVHNRNIRRWTTWIVAALFFQLLYGALMAGHKAASAAPTWPTINGDWIPDVASIRAPMRFLIANKILIQFIHRGIAYLILVMISIWTIKAYSLQAVPAYFELSRWMPLALVLIQIILGVMTLLYSPGIVANHWVAFDWLAQAHQLIGMLLLLTMVAMLYLVNRPRPVRPVKEEL